MELLEQSPEISLRCLNILSRCCPGRKSHFISTVHNNEFPYYELLNFAEKQSIVLKERIFSKNDREMYRLKYQKFTMWGWEMVQWSQEWWLLFWNTHIRILSSTWWLPVACSSSPRASDIFCSPWEPRAYVMLGKISKQSTHANKINLYKFIMIITWFWN